MSQTQQSRGLLSLLGSMREYIREFGKFHQATTNGSLPEFLKNTSVNPLVMVDARVAYDPIADGVMMATNELIALMYLQVASRLTNQDIDAVRVTRVLEKLSTERDVLGSIAATEAENCFIGHAIGLENYRDVEGAHSTGQDPKANMNVIEAPSLAVGKVVTLVFTHKGEKLPVPVSIRLNPHICQASLIADIFKANHQDFNIIDKVKLGYLEGETLGETLFSLKDLRRQENIRKQDIDGVISNHFNKAMKEAGYSAMTGEVAINRASAAIIIDQSSVSTIETAIKGKLSKFKDREKFMAGSSAMLVAVVDREDEMVDFYYRGFTGASTLTFRQLGKLSGGSNPSVDLTEALTDMMSGSVPKL